jgi:glycosyltransferase involved in cell wall biosynthesis
VRLALFTTSFPSNADTVVNAGACVKDFAEVLTELGHEVVVLTPNKRGARHEFSHRETVFFPWLGSADSVSHIDMKSPVGLLQLASVVALGSLAATRLVRRFRPDHVLCFWVFPSGMWARVAEVFSGTPYSTWALGSDIWVLGKIPGFRPILRLLAHGSQVRYADGIALAGDYARISNDPVEFLATSRVVHVPPLVSVGEGGYYLYLGRYHPNKGIDLLIEAIGKVKDELPGSFRLRAHGFGPLEESVRARVRELHLEGMVEIHGPTAAGEVAEILRRARGLVIPSRIESVPLVLSDGLQMELPLLVTNVGDMGVLVTRYRAGIVCEPTVEELSRALVRFTTEPPLPPSPALRDLLDIRASVRRFLVDISKGVAGPASGSLFHQDPDVVGAEKI